MFITQCYKISWLRKTVCGRSLTTTDYLEINTKEIIYTNQATLSHENERIPTKNHQVPIP